MAYRWKPSDASATAFLRRVADEQIGKALASLQSEEMPREAAVHDVRKRLKKLRGLVRLVRPAFPDYAAENVAFRDAARVLAPLRDSAAVLESYGRVVALDTLDGRRTLGLRRHLEEARDAAREHPEADGRIDECRLRLNAARERAGAWLLTEDGWPALSPGLQLSYERGREAMKAARKSRDGDDLHEWRKRAKYHWYHARLLEPVWPEVMAPHIAAASRLSDLLGDRHDLDVMATQIASAGLGEEQEALLREAMEGEARRLDGKALALGARLFAEKPAPLAKRWGKWWRLAQAS
ncbi:CHAD domain-containing protein [Pseudoroseicyclus tamaricis]|uniref:CHAD domain-containing protein n=1 Tax=Pseudoroseicyclus tamaricis TaxID=2705421 RepID=A0A6B2JNL9_9RHOB|nr:CHAD domain-containing protein [Pseudoroseicyclus tamaricis]NDU99524.1 CHAD domain-containing protein [Pseudoroseicyclus tamaricis]